VVLAGLLLSLSLGCGEDETPATAKPPTRQERPPANVELGEWPDASSPIGVDANLPEPPRGELPACCEVTFVMPVQGDDEYAARLFGNRAPFDTPRGLAMERRGDTWQVEACVDVTQGGLYYYEVGLGDPAVLPDAGPSDASVEDLFPVHRINPFVTGTDSPNLGLANVLEAAASCDDFDATVHAAISASTP
jgi:hypothetical protein